ncbi:MAG: CoA transferase [Bacteroidota bacterium]
MNQSSFFSGFTILELSSVLAGPAVGTFFAELGAKVIKVENAKTGGDITRKWKLGGEPTEQLYSAYFCAVNWGKESILLDLNQPDDRSIVYAILTEVDIVISNFHQDAAKKLGMDFQTLLSHKSNLIIGHISGYGIEDPTPAFDVVLQAETGYLYMTGEPGRLPVKMPVALIDVLAAHQLKEGLLIALINLAKTGKGSIVSTSLFDAAIASLVNQATNWLEVGHIPQPMGTKHPNIAPYGDMVNTKDGELIVLACGTDKHFKHLCIQLNAPELVVDPRFATNVSRINNRKALMEILQSIFAELEFVDIHSQLKAAGIPCGSVRQMNEVFEVDLAKNMILEEDMPDGKRTRRVRTAAFKIKTLDFDKN